MSTNNNMPEKTSIFLIGNKPHILQQLVDSLVQHQMEYKLLDAPAVNLKQKGIYVLMPGTKHNKPLKELLRIKVQNNGYVIFY